MANITQGGGTTSAGYTLPELVVKRVQYAIQEKRGLISHANDTKEEYFGAGWKVHWPIMPKITAGTVSYPLAFSDYNTTRSSATPVVKWAGVNIQEDVLLTMITDAAKAYSPAVAEAILQIMETDMSGLHASTGATIGDASTPFSEINLQAAVGKLVELAGDKLIPGRVCGAFHTTLFKNFLGVQNIISASVRGGNEAGAAKTALLRTVYGMDLIFTGNMNTGAGKRNLIFTDEWAWVARKNRPKVETEREELALKIIGSHMYAVAILLNNLGVLYQTT